MEGAIFSNSVENSIRKCPKEEESKKRKVSKTFLGKYHTIHSKSQVVLELESSRSEVVILVGTFNKILAFRSFQVLISNLTCKKSKNLIFKPTIVEIDSFVG